MSLQNSPQPRMLVSVTEKQVSVYKKKVFHSKFKEKHLPKQNSNDFALTIKSEYKNNLTNSFKKCQNN